MADSDDFDLNSLLPLLLKQYPYTANYQMQPSPGDIAAARTRQSVIPSGGRQDSGAADVLGRALVPGLGAAMDLAGGNYGEAVADAASSALPYGASAIGRLAKPLINPALAAATAGAVMSPQSVGEAQAARLTPEQRQQIEMQKQQSAIATQAEANRIKAQSEANANAAKMAAETQRQLEEQRRVDAENAAKRQREQPFREKYSTAAEWMPAVGMAASAAIPFGKGVFSKIPLGRFTREWEGAGTAAKEALKGRAKGPATLATNVLRDYESKWPSMEKRYTPGLGQTALTSIIPAELTAFPTEYDYMTQPPGSPSKPTFEDWAATAGRAGIAGLAGTGAAKFGAGLVPKTRPYVGGPGIIRSYESKYPPTKAQQKAIAEALKQQRTP